jgi:predicted histone-like DNA-binding protein
MSVKYKLYQDNRRNSLNNGKWYARAIPGDKVDLETLSQEIQDNTTAKQADVYAVLKELVNVMDNHLKNGDRVVLDGFGSFKIGLKSVAADTREDFNPVAHIVGARVNFQPEAHWTATDRKHRKQFLQDIQVKLAESTKKQSQPGGGTTPTP